MTKKAACVLLRNKEGKILAVSRKDDPNALGLPGGKVDPGETFEIAAIRECLEETGIDIFNLKPVFKRTCTDGWEGVSSYDSITFEAEFDENKTPKETNEKETGRVIWVDPVELTTGPFAKYNCKLFETIGLKV